jgi:hypothetical protein
MPAQAYNGDQEDRPHPLWRVSRPGQLHLATMSYPKIGVTLGHEEEKLQARVT